MSEIKSEKQDPPVRSPRDVLHLYTGALENPNLEHVSKIGMEMECNLYKRPGLTPLTEEEGKKFICQGKRQAINIHNEPSATTLEILSDPFTRENFDDLIAQMDRRFGELWDLSTQCDAYPSPFGYLPHVRPEDHHPVRNERYIAFWVPPRADMVDAFHSFLDPSIQVSISYNDFDHLLRIIRLSVALEPFFILTTEADAGYYEGAAVTGSPRTRILKRRGRNGGIPGFYLSARSGEELIHDHIEHTLHNQHIFACFNHEKDLQKLPNDVWASFSELEELGYGPQDLLNYRQAQSESWRRTVNIAEIRNSEGDLFGHRAEISSLFCTGLQHQRASAAVLTYLLSYCQNFYGSMQGLLKDFGIDLERLDDCKKLLDQNFEAAHNHQGCYYDLPFGTGTLRDFAQGFAAAIEDCLKDSPLKNHCAPLLHILNTGRPDWLVHREIFENLDQQKAYMAALPDLVKDHPELLSAQSCADMTKDIILSSRSR